MHRIAVGKKQSEEKEGYSGLEQYAFLPDSRKSVPIAHARFRDSSLSTLTRSHFALTTKS